MQVMKVSWRVVGACGNSLWLLMFSQWINKKENKSKIISLQNGIERILIGLQRVGKVPNLGKRENELARKMKEEFLAPLKFMGHDSKWNQASLVVCFPPAMQAKVGEEFNQIYIFASWGGQMKGNVANQESMYLRKWLLGWSRKIKSGKERSEASIGLSDSESMN